MGGPVGGSLVRARCGYIDINIAFESAEGIQKSVVRNPKFAAD